MTDKDGGPAFPFSFDETDGSRVAVAGMSLRDYFAGQEMGSRLAWFAPYDGNFNKVAVDAYRLADAMLEARKR